MISLQCDIDGYYAPIDDKFKSKELNAPNMIIFAKYEKLKHQQENIKLKVEKK